MEEINLNNYLNREKEIDMLKNILLKLEENKHDLNQKRGIYVYGNPGIGKTTLVNTVLKEMNYDIVHYDSSDARNTMKIDDITKNTMSDRNIMSMFTKKIKKIVIVMDEIDCMNTGDKGGINALIKLIRPKKTKKQKLEVISLNPIICIGNYRADKKIKELMKVSNTIEIPTPTKEQIKSIIKNLFTNLDESLYAKLFEFVQYDLRKLDTIYSIYKKNNSFFTSNCITNVLQTNTYNNETKKIIKDIMNTPHSIENHNTIMNETDRTSVGLLWHENIIDMIETIDKSKSITFYIEQLNNICFSDYIDRITFQNQIWQFNEMSSLIKTFKNAKLYHDYKFKTKKKISDIRFTKVLTKYSTEYNNYLFIQKLCQTLSMDKSDLFGYFIYLKLNYNESDILNLFENYDISKLDINRMYRYIDKFSSDTNNGNDSEEIYEILET